MSDLSPALALPPEARRRLVAAGGIGRWHLPDGSVLPPTAGPGDESLAGPRLRDGWAYVQCDPLAVVAVAAEMADRREWGAEARVGRASAWISGVPGDYRPIFYAASPHTAALALLASVAEEVTYA